MMWCYCYHLRTVVKFARFINLMCDMKTNS